VADQGAGEKEGVKPSRAGFNPPLSAQQKMAGLDPPYAGGALSSPSSGPSGHLLPEGEKDIKANAALLLTLGRAIIAAAA